jgi:hypothetical protein
MKVPIPIAVLAGAALVCAASACAGFTPTSAELSNAFEPPPSWDAAVLFVFRDSTFVPNADDSALVVKADYAATIEFYDGVRRRLITSRDQFDAPTGERRTSWYRLHPDERGAATTVRVTLNHASGAQTTAEYPLTVHRNEYVSVYADVYARDPGERYISMPQHRQSFPLHQTARAQPGDSLWISHAARNRECFECPR